MKKRMRKKINHTNKKNVQHCKGDKKNNAFSSSDNLFSSTDQLVGKNIQTSKSRFKFF
jgi:hypothetical protein